MVCIPYHLSLTSENALDVVKGYDIVLDATDNVASRYLLNDLCVLTGKPLVSGSALRFEGQVGIMFTILSCHETKFYLIKSIFGKKCVNVSKIRN